MKTLFDPIRLGALSLRNRVIMAPMTRSRAGEGDAPSAMNAEYYRQRANAGLYAGGPEGYIGYPAFS